jgi:hypothetical protein
LSLLGGVPPPPKADTPLAVAAICEAIDRPALMLFRKTKASAAITEAPAVANAPAVPVALAAWFAAFVLIIVLAIATALSAINAAACTFLFFSNRSLTKPIPADILFKSDSLIAASVSATAFSVSIFSLAAFSSASFCFALASWSCL